MEYSNWKQTVVDWLNCLSITASPISDIQDLLDGNIFISLIRTLKDLPESSSSLTPIQELTLFLNDEYPEYKTNYNNTISGNEELISISCILIHYCCIRCENKHFKELMCNRLDERTQKQIAHLLQSMVEHKNKISRDVIFNCISKHKYKLSPPETRFVSPSSSPLRSFSNVFQSPFSPKTPYNTLLEKSSWEVRRLQAELDSEKFDKAFLEEKLKTHAEKITHLIEDQKKYIAEVKSLRHELCSKENNPPNQNDVNQLEHSASQDMNLKKEIEYLEDELHRLQREIDLLQSEKDANKQKIYQVDSQCQMWQERANDLEQFNESLQFELNQRNNEVASLKEQCAELTNYINEYRNTQRLNISIEGLDMSTSNSSPEETNQNDEENLACSVIDVQLREREDENIKLVRKIDDLENEIIGAKQLCQEQYVLVQMKQDELETMSNLFQLKQQELLLQMQEKCVLQTEMESLNSTLQERSKLLESTENRATMLYDELTETNIKVAKTQESLNEHISRMDAFQLLNDEMKKYVENSRLLLAEKIHCLLNITSSDCTNISASEITFEDAIKYLQDIISATNKNCILREDLEKHIADLANQVQNLKDEAFHTNSDNLKLTEELNNQIESTKQCYFRLENESREQLSSLESLLSEKLMCIEELKNLNDNLEILLSNKSVECEILCAEGKKLNENIAELKISESLINEKYIESRATIQELSKSLSDQTIEIASILTSSKENLEKYDALEKQFLDMKVTNQSLLSEKLLLEKNVEDYSSKIVTYETVLKQLKENKKHYEKEHTEITHELEKLNSSYELIQEERKSVEKGYINSINEYKSKIIDLENIISELNIEKASIGMELDEKCIALEQMRESTSDISKTCAQKILQKDLEIEKLELIIENHKSSIEELREQSNNRLKENEEKRQELILQNAELQNNVSVLDQQNTDRKSRLMHQQEKYLLLESELETLKEASLALHSELNLKGRFINDIQEKYEKLTSENNELEKDKISSAQQIEAMQKCSIEAEKRYLSLQSENIDLKQIVSTAEKEIASLIESNNTLQEAKDDLDNLKTKMAGYEKCIETEKHHKDLMNEEFAKESRIKEERIEHLLEETVACKKEQGKLQEMYNDISVEVEVLKENLLKAEKAKDILEIEEQNYSKKIAEMIVDKDTLLSKISQAEEATRDITNKLTMDYEEKVNQMSEQLKIIDEKNNHLQRDLNESRHRMEEIDRINNNLQNELDGNIKTLDALKEENLIITKAIKAAQSEYTDLTEVLKTKNEKVQDLEQKLAAATSSYVENCKKIEENATEIYNNEVKEKNKLMLQIKELTETLEMVDNEKVCTTNELDEKLHELDTEKELNKQLRSLLDEEILNKENLSALIQDMRNEKSLLHKTFDEIRVQVSDIKISLDTLKSLHRDLIVVEHLEWHNTDLIAGETETIEINNFLKSLVFELEKFVTVYKNYTAVQTEKRELEQKYNILKQESDKLVLESKLNLQILEGCNKDLLAEKQIMVSELDELKHVTNKCSDLETEVNNLHQQQKKTTELESKLQNVELENYSMNEKCIKEEDCIQLESFTIPIKTIISDVFSLFKRFEVHKKCYEEILSASYEKLNSGHILNAKSEIEEMVSNIQNEFCTVSVNVIDTLVNHVRSKSLANRNKLLEKDEFDSADLLHKVQEIKTLSKLASEKCEVFGDKISKYQLEKQLGEDVYVKKLEQDVEFYKNKYFTTRDTLSSVTETKHSMEKKLIELRFENSSLLAEKEKNSLIKTENIVSVKTEPPSPNKIQNQLNKEIIKLNQELSDVILVKDNLSQELISLKEKFFKVSEKLTDFQNNQNYFDNTELRKELTVIIKQLEEETLKSQVFKKHNENLMEELRSLDTKYNSLKLQYAENDEQKSKKINDMMHMIHNLQSNSVLDAKVDMKVKEVRNEYEGKLEKMKTKMKELYAEEMVKVNEKQDMETTRLQLLCKKYSDKIKEHEAHVVHLSNELFTLGDKMVKEENKNATLRAEILHLKNKNLHSELNYKHSKESLNERPQFKEEYSFMQDVGDRSSSRTTANNEYRFKQERLDGPRNDTKRHITLPKDFKQGIGSNVGYMDIIEEKVTTTKRMSMKPVQSNVALHMEDEDSEMFNNTYLSDLKAGRCNYGNSELPKESSTTRLSELRWRNSLCPPHLKSTYATELQFNQCKEEDLKGGLNPFETSSSSLLPGEKNRLSKERAGTAYKKPGPPTPSKNGGRQSLQGNEVHPREILKEFNENVKEKKKTPNRLKALFSTSTKQSSQMGKGDNEFSFRKVRSVSRHKNFKVKTQLSNRGSQSSKKPKPKDAKRKKNEPTTPRRLSFFRKAR